MSTAANDVDTTTRVDDERELLRRARAVIRAEAEAVARLEERLDESFLEAVRVVAAATGRVIVSGVGKSGIIGRKIAATLTSTGTPAMFLHPVEGVHGDLGIVGRDDVAILISKSGESAELAGLVEFLSRFGVSMIALTGRMESMLARAARVALDCSVLEEACPMDLAPTTSTTVTLAMGDALAVALLLRKGFTRDDFARLHPGGALGRKLTLRVRDVMIAEEALLPTIGKDESMRRCVVLLAEMRGTAIVVDGARHVIGVVTAGDLTRLMEKRDDVLDVPVREVMNVNPKTIDPETLAAAAVFQMETHGIMALPVVDGDGRLRGIVHLHDLMRAGAV
ncbi:MAG TPA: KpsF/GutQ family sugar-phosphate isomerase [Longimicrobiales bacterium]|nr:KpsF/GutQ family sugar-phosphate isomerase [Longimicrobiales bacterium]